MERGDLIERVVLMPMRIKLQKENGLWIAVMPGWQLPAYGMIFYGVTQTDAINKLDEAMRRYWGE